MKFVVTYRPAEREGDDESGVGFVRFDKREGIAGQDGSWCIAVGARTWDGHVTLVLLEAQSEMSGAFTLTGATGLLTGY
jgi:hypothetical protein